MVGRLKEAEAMTLEQYQDHLTDRDPCARSTSRLRVRSGSRITLSAGRTGAGRTSHLAIGHSPISGSLLGVPALSLPLFQTGGLPLGLQVLGFSQRDADLFGIAAEPADDQKPELAPKCIEPDSAP